MHGDNILQFPPMAPKILDIRYPNRIRELRLGLKLTLQQLAERAGLSKSFLGKLEIGERELSTAWMERIAPHLGVDPADLMLLDQGGLSDKERHIIATYREIPEAMRASIEAVAESQQPFRGAAEVVPLGADRPARKSA